MDKPFESDHTGLEEFGLRYDHAKECVVWEETLSYAPDSEFSKNIDANIAADDRAFLAAIGVTEWTGDADVPRLREEDH